MCPVTIVGWASKPVTITGRLLWDTVSHTLQENQKCQNAYTKDDSKKTVWWWTLPNTIIYGYFEVVKIVFKLLIMWIYALKRTNDMNECLVKWILKLEKKKFFMFADLSRD